jgi:uncharacterized protein
LILKILAFVAVLFLIYIIFFKKNRNINMKNNTKKDTTDQIEDIMVECPTCGTFVSKDDAILSNGKYYCSSECLRK